LNEDDLSENILESLRAAIPESEGDDSVFIDTHSSFGLRVPLLAKAFPKAKFIHIVRAAAPAIVSGVQAWSSGKFVTQPNLPKWWGEKWSFTLTPGWEELIGKPLAEIVAGQHVSIMNKLIGDLGEIESARVARLSYESLIEAPADQINRICAELRLSWSAELPETLPLSQNTISKPAKDKWKKSSSEVLVALRSLGPEVQKIRETVAPLLPLSSNEAEDENLKSQNAVSRASTGTPFSSTHSKSLTQLLTNAGISLLVTTYKSGHAILVRPEGEVINTSFKRFKRPMGIAVAGSRLAIGTEDSILSFVNQPGLTKAIEPKDTHDVVYAPRASVQTGDISIHEMAYGQKDGQDNLWFVNTKFSCLCKQDLNYSFVPVWRPKWITQYAAEDRCHLNGLALVDGEPKYVTALSETDTPNGWREHKGTSGVIIDVQSDEVVASGLSMPHSPRWHQGKLWVLESGKGTLATVDTKTGEVTTVATLPGFTRGLTFFRSYAFIGLSQVRESVFKSLPVTEQTEERNCGVWVVDIRTGKTVAFLKFSGVVQELFDVAIIPNAKWPTIIEASEKTLNSFVLDSQTLQQVKRN
jgi:uncharacterized protein (TIGR03032 family)